MSRKLRYKTFRSKLVIQTSTVTRDEKNREEGFSRVEPTFHGTAQWQNRNVQISQNNLAGGAYLVFKVEEELWCSLTNDNKITGVFREFFRKKNFFFHDQTQDLSRQREKKIIRSLSAKRKKNQVISVTVAATEMEST